jgi:hypothetical protein
MFRGYNDFHFLEKEKLTNLSFFLMNYIYSKLRYDMQGTVCPRGNLFENKSWTPAKALLKAVL